MPTYMYTDPVDLRLARLHAAQAQRDLTPAEQAELLAIACDLRLRLDLYVNEAILGMNEGFQS